MITFHRALVAVVVALTLAALVGVALLWPDELPELASDESAQQSEDFAATIVDVQPVEGGAAADASGTGDDVVIGSVPGAVEVELTARLADSGRRVRFTTTDDTGDLYEPGQRVELTRITGVDPAGGESEPVWLVGDFRRDTALGLLAAAFVVVVVALGRWHGLRALVSLAASIAVVVGFMVPAILTGSSPVLVALSGAMVILVVTIVLTHGPGPKSVAAMVGTAGSLLVTAGLAQLFVEVASLTGLASEDARAAAFSVSGLSLQGLLLAGIIVGSLGVLDDVTVSQASTVFELRAAAPEASFGQVLRGALNVGRDHVAATINTLALAYVGAALPLLLLFTLADQSVASVLTSEVVAVEIVRTLVGSIGLMTAVPLTTLLAAGLAAGSSGRQLAAEHEEEWLTALREA